MIRFNRLKQNCIKRKIVSEKRITQSLLLPDLKFIKESHTSKSRTFHCEKTSEFEVCPKCATPSSSIYDHRYVVPRDENLRGKLITLKIKKRRFRCKNEQCNKVFTEPVNGIIKGFRTTQRFRSYIRHLCSKYMSLKEVRYKVKCSNSTIYKAFYSQLDLENRKQQYCWPKTLGIDEHSFNRNVGKRDRNRREFVSVFIDYNNKRMREVVLGKSIWDLKNSRIADIEGRENVKNVITDLSPTYRSFVEDFFPNARIIADKFHVVKLMHPLLNQLRRETVEMYQLNRNRGNPVNKLIYKYHRKLRWEQRRVMKKFLSLSEDLNEVYQYQQRLYTVYKVRGYNRAKRLLYKLLDDMAYSKNKRVLSYRNTLRKWAQQILNYFSTGGLNNGRTEGYNCKAKLIQRCAYGFRSFTNYRLKLLYHCR